MANDFISAQNIRRTSPSPAQVELLEAILVPSDATYPWNTSDPESEEYFVEVEQKTAIGDWVNEDIATRTPSFFSSLEQLWSRHTLATLPNLLTTLQQFRDSVPQAWLQSIAASAQQVSESQKSMAEKLVACVQVLLPQWADEDLLVLARPFAYAMRGTEPETIEVMLSNAHSPDWTMLSEIEQARVAIAIANYALAYLGGKESEA